MSEVIFSTPPDQGTNPAPPTPPPKGKGADRIDTPWPAIRAKRSLGIKQTVKKKNKKKKNK